MTQLTAVPSPDELALAQESLQTPGDPRQMRLTWGIYFAQNMLLGIREGTFVSQTGGRIFMVPPALQQPYHNPIRNCPADPCENAELISSVLEEKGWKLDCISENRGEIPFNWHDRSQIFGYDLFVSRISANKAAAA